MQCVVLCNRRRRENKGQKKNTWLNLRNYSRIQNIAQIIVLSACDRSGVLNLASRNARFCLLNKTNKQTKFRGPPDQINETKRLKKKKDQINWAVTGLHHIQYTVLSVHRCFLPRWVQTWCVQGRVSSPHPAVPPHHLWCPTPIHYVSLTLSTHSSLTVAEHVSTWCVMTGVLIFQLHCWLEFFIFSVTFLWM